MPAFKILMIAPTSFFGDYGGHIRIYEETKALQALGHQVVIVTYYMGANLPGIHIERTAPLPYRANYEVGSSRHKLAFDLFLAAKAGQIAHRFKPDIIHGHMHEGALIGGAVARWRNIPLVFDFQGSLTGEMIDHGFLRQDGMITPWALRLERFISSRLPQAILTSSSQAGELLRQEFGVPQEIIHPLPDCANLALFDPRLFSQEDKEEARQELGIPVDAPVVVYLGLLADYQGTTHLIEAAARLKDAGKKVWFLIMGYPNEAKYKTLAVGYGVSDRIVFTGRVDYVQDAPRFLAVGDIAVSPKMSATEGSGKNLNYMALAKPVVAYDTPVHREYLGEWGCYAPVGNVPAFTAKIELLLDDFPQRELLGAKLRDRAKRRFSWVNAAQQIESLYKRLTNPFSEL